MKIFLSLSLPLLLVAAGAQVSQAKWDANCRRCSDVGNDDFVSPYNYHCDRRVDNTICQEMDCRTMPYENNECNKKCPALMCRPMGGKYDCPPLDCSKCNSSQACVPKENYCPFVTYDPRCCPSEIQCVANTCECPAVTEGCAAYSTNARGEDGCVKCLQKCNGKVGPREGTGVGQNGNGNGNTGNNGNGNGNGNGTGQLDPTTTNNTCPNKNCRKHNECDSDEICTMEPVKFSDCYGSQKDSSKCCMKRKCYPKRHFKKERNNKCWGKSKSSCNSSRDCKWFSYVKPNGKKVANCRERPFKF